jgi:hypothetical protein
MVCWLALLEIGKSALNARVFGCPRWYKVLYRSRAVAWRILRPLQPLSTTVRWFNGCGGFYRDAPSTATGLLPDSPRPPVSLLLFAAFLCSLSETSRTSSYPHSIPSLGNNSQQKQMLINYPTVTTSFIVFSSVFICLYSTTINLDLHYPQKCIIRRQILPITFTLSLPVCNRIRSTANSTPVPYAALAKPSFETSGRPLKIEVVIDFSTAPLASRLAPAAPAAPAARPRAAAGAVRG